MVDFNSSPSLDPLTMLLLGGAAGLGQAGATSRMPISPASVFGGLGQGLMAGQQMANQSMMQQQDAISKAAQNQLLLSQLGMMQGGGGTPTGQDVLSGRFRLNPDYNKLFAAMGWGTGQPAQTSAPPPQMPAPALQQSAATAAPAAPAASGPLQKLTVQVAQNNGFDPQFALAHINGESGFDPMALGPAVTGNSLYPGSPQPRPKGIAQIDDAQAKRYNVDPWNAVDTLTNAYGPMFAKLLADNGGNYVAATQAYGTIPHDLSKMDGNQTAVYQAAVAANQRAGNGANTQLAQNIPPQNGSGIAQLPGQSAAPGGTQVDPQTLIAANLLRRQMLPITPVEQAAMNAQLYPPGSPMRALMDNQATHLSGVEPFVNQRGQLPLRYNPQTGQQELAVPPGYIQGQAALNAATAGGTSAGKLPFVGPEETARANAANQAKFGDLQAPPGQGPSATPPPNITVPNYPPGTPLPLPLIQQNMTAKAAALAGNYPVDPQNRFGTVIPPLQQQGPLGAPAQLEASIPAWQKTVTEWNGAVAPAAQAEQRLNTIAGAFKNIQTGAFQTDKAAVAAAMNALGIPVDTSNAANVELALHENAVATLQRLKATTSRFTQQEFKTLSSVTEHPNLQPEANLQMLSEDIANLQRAQALPQDWQAAQTLGWRNPQAFESSWNSQNPVDQQVDRIKQQIGPLKGMPGWTPQGQQGQAGGTGGMPGPVVTFGGKQYYKQDGRWFAQ